jgi:drug/metabolite transporter (DMT)-like permease
VSSFRPGAAIALAYLTLCVLWSTTWIGIKVGLHGTTPLIGVGLRSLIAGFCFAAFRLATAGSLRVPREKWRFVATTACCVFGVPYALVYLGETKITSGLAAVLSGTLPLFSALIAARLLSDEPVTASKLAGIAIGLGGLVVVFHGALTLDASTLATLASIGVLLGPAFLAFGQVLGRREAGTVPTALLLAWAMFLAGGMLLSIGLAVGPRRLALDGRTLGSIAYLALAGSVAGFALLYWLLARIKAVSVSLLNLVLPILALLEGWAVYGEPLNLSLVLGSVVVTAGIGLATVGSIARTRRSCGETVNGG